MEGLTWPEAYNLALEGRVDLLPCVGVTKERQDHFLLTNSYLKYQRAIFSLSDGIVYKFKDMKNISVGVQRNSSNYSYLVYETDIDPVLFDDTESLLSALSVGEIDAAVANYSSAKYTANQLGINNIIVGEIMDSDTAELTMAVNRNKPMLVAILNKALAQISEEQKILIKNKWLGIETEPDYSRIYQYGIIGLVIVAAIMLILILWTRSLKKHIEERKEAEQKIKLLLESVGEGIIGVDIRGRVNFTNSEALELLGYANDELLGQPIHQMIHHTHADANAYDISECPIYKAYTLGESNNIHDEVLWRADGGSFDAEYTSVPILKDDAIEGAVIVFKDITERKRQQQETKRALEKVEKLYTTSLALRSTINLNEVLRVILSSLREIVSFNTATIQEFKDGEFRVIYCEGFSDPESIVGLTFACEEGTLNQKVMDKKSTVVIRDVRRYKEFVDMSEGKRIRSFMAVPLAINDNIIGELTLDSYEAGYYNAEMAATAEAFAAQAAVALNNANNFKELEKAKAAAEQASRAKGDFLANMSHEIRTPMNAIMGLLSLLTYTHLSPKQNDYVKKIDNASKNLLNIINDILDFSKIESGMLSIEKIEYNLDDVLSSLSDVLSLKAEAKGIEFIISKDENVPSGLIGDPLRLEQILLNLTNNAIKFTDKGEVIVKVAVDKQNRKGALVRFSVIDSGIGMTKAQMSGLFNAFVQADASTTRRYGGTGLGLSISKNLVELMGGKIGAKSQYGKGSEFYFTIPFTLSQQVPAAKATIPSEVSGLEVLVVEDNAYARDVIDNYLQRFGLNAALVSCGEEAVEEAAKYHFDLFIIDYKMPGINGVETWAKIKEIINPEAQQKAILISSYSKHEILDEAKKEAFADILSKPLTQSVLYDAIVNAFGRKERTDEKQGAKADYPKGLSKIRGAKILVVEDNEINQQVAKELLERQGFYVDLAGNGQVAVEKLKAGEDYDLIFMDLQMPIMDGYTAARTLRGVYHADQPIIALSADAMDNTEDAAREAGMNDYMAKPIDTQELYEKLVKYIEPNKRKKNEQETLKPSAALELEAKKTLLSFDVGNGIKRFGGNTGLYVSTLNKFAKNYINFAEELRGLLAEGKKEESKRMLHGMKGVSGNVGAVNLNRMVKACEQVLAQDDGADKLSDESLDEISGELTSIAEQIGKLNHTAVMENITAASTVAITEAEMTVKLKKLRKLLKQYDTGAKDIFDEIQRAEHSADHEKFKAMGELIDDYDFDSASRICGELIKDIEKRVNSQ